MFRFSQKQVLELHFAIQQYKNQDKLTFFEIFEILLCYAWNV